MTTKVTRDVLDLDVRTIPAINFATNATLKINSSLVNKGLIVTNGSGQMSALIPGNSKVLTTNSSGDLGSIAYATAGTADTIVLRDGSGEFGGTAARARYADLAERYFSGREIAAGSVVCFDGAHEVSLCYRSYCCSVAGVISTQAAFKMNSEAGPDETHPYVAMVGRVPCRVIGPVRAGDLVVSSGLGGVAKAANWFWVRVNPHAVIGRVIADDPTEGERLVEIQLR
jgi:hypothetical protein